jgi:CRP-like cAMP-binding protein
MSQNQYTQILVRRLKSVHNLGSEEEAAIHALPLRIMELKAGQDIVREGDRPTRCCIVFDGLTSWYKTTGEGVRQIIAFQTSGDIPDLQSIHLDRLDSSLLTMSKCTVGFIDHDAVRYAASRHPQIASALWRTTLIDAAIFREWVINVGGRKAPARIAHLLCEQVTRMRVVGLVKEDFSCWLPLTQGDLAAATGLSNVHVNRSLQLMRRLGLITFSKSVLTVLDWQGLQDLGDFDPEYLFLVQPGRAGVPVEL